MQIDSYLERIEYTGSRELTSQTLEQLHRAHMLAVPFENFDICLNHPIELSLPSFYDKIVSRRRGGFCYELNGLFGWLLEQLGFTVVMLAAEVFDDPQPEHKAGHLLLLVELEERWIADVGFGDSFQMPLRLDALASAEQQSGTYRLTTINASRGARKLLERRQAGKWKPQYLFSLASRRLNDFGDVCHHQQTSSASRFRRTALCSLATAEGRITLSNNRLITTTNGQRIEQEIESEQTYRTLLKTRFGIDLGEKAPYSKLMNPTAVSQRHR